MMDIAEVLAQAWRTVFFLGFGLTILLVLSVAVGLRIRRIGSLVIVTKRDFIVQNADTGDDAIIFAGTHAVERISNPCSENGIPWIVMRGTKIGMPEDYWQRLEGKRWAHFQVEIIGSP